MKKGLVFLAIVSVLLLAMLMACSGGSDSGNEDPQPQPGRIAGNVFNTHTGQPLSINITITGAGIQNIIVSDANGNYTSEELQPGVYTIMYNYPEPNPEVIPSQLRNITLSGGIININIDLADVSTLFPDQNYEGRIEFYRGRGNHGVNQVWVRQPDKWVIYDPNNELLNHPEYIDDIFEGFNKIERYTDGFLIAPDSLDDPDFPGRIEIHYGYEEPGEDYTISFYARGPPGEGESVNSNNQIYRSGATARPEDTENIHAELLASIQGGDSESNSFTGCFDSGEFTNDDLIWGKFNYILRKPGDVMVPPSESQYEGLVYEIRLISGINYSVSGFEELQKKSSTPKIPKRIRKQNRPKTPLKKK